MRNVTIGQYFPGNSLLHRLDPRTKIVLTVALIVIIFIVERFAGFGLIVLLLVLCALSTKIKPKYMLRGLKPLYLIIALTFLLNLFLVKEGRDIVHWGFFRVTTGGLNTALFMALRLMLLVLGSQLLTFTTSPIALTDGMEALMKPLSKIGFPAHEIAMMMSIALRFIPTLMEETEKIKRAQMARGADFESGRLIARAKALIPILVPLFISAFRRADELAVAMEARCYRGGEGRTKMKVLKFGVADLLALLVFVALLAGVILLNRFSPV